MGNYKVTYFKFKLKILDNIFKDGLPQLEKYINEMSEQGWELITTESDAIHFGILCFWKKKS